MKTCGVRHDEITHLKENSKQIQNAYSQERRKLDYAYLNFCIWSISEHL